MRLATIAKRQRAQCCILKPIAFLAVLAISALPQNATADEGGVSFWVPGFVSSLAATPLVPGFSFANVLYYSNVKAGADVAFARQVNRGNINVNFNGNLTANIKGNAQPLYLALPGYTFATPVLGGQASVLLGIPYGRIRSTVDATLTGT